MRAQQGERSATTEAPAHELGDRGECHDRIDAEGLRHPEAVETGSGGPEAASRTWPTLAIAVPAP